MRNMAFLVMAVALVGCGDTAVTGDSPYVFDATRWAADADSLLRYTMTEDLVDKVLTTDMTQADVRALVATLECDATNTICQTPLGTVPGGEPETTYFLHLEFDADGQYVRARQYKN